MMNILTLIVNSLKGLVQGFVGKTNDSSKDGSEDSTGNGKSNGKSSINWTNIIIFVLVGVGCYFIPSPFQRTMPYPTTGTSHNETAVRGIPDSSWITQPIHHGADANVDSVVYTGNMDPILVQIAIPDYVENVTIVKDSTVNGIIRATAYTYWRDYEIRDTLDIDVILEWNLQAAPHLMVTREDTVYSMDSTWIPVEVPFIEKPVVVVAGTLVGVAILYTVVEFVKSLGK